MPFLPGNKKLCVLVLKLRSKERGNAARMREVKENMFSLDDLKKGTSMGLICTLGYCLCNQVMASRTVHTCT